MKPKIAEKELTDNDKAALMLGWKPVKYDYVHWFWRGEDNMRSPDMKRPENYIKAAREAYRQLFVKGNPRLTGLNRSYLVSALETVLYADDASQLIEFLAGCAYPKATHEGTKIAGDNQQS